MEKLTIIRYNAYADEDTDPIELTDKTLRPYICGVGYAAAFNEYPEVFNNYVKDVEALEGVLNSPELFNSACRVLQAMYAMGVYDNSSY